jgi:hypothetical protein
MATGDKYVVTLQSTFSPDPLNTFVNVFAYEGAGTGSTASDLYIAFLASIVAGIASIVADAVDFGLTTVVNLDDPADFYIATAGISGVRTGQTLPQFNAWEYEYLRATRSVHNGRKSFSVITEGDQANGIADPTFETTDLEPFAVALSSDLLGFASASYIPRIWRRAGTYVSGTFPDTFYPISGVVYNRISTQNTRKR